MKYYSLIFLLFTLNAKINEQEITEDIKNMFGEQLKENNITVNVEYTGEEKVNKKSTDIYFKVTLSDENGSTS